MKKILFAALVLMSMTPNQVDPLPIGSALPLADVKLKDVTGTEVSFRENMRKNGLLVMFSCNTCPVVGMYQSRTIEVTKLANSKEIGVVLLNSNEATRESGDSYEDMQAYAKAQGYDFAYALDKDSKMADAFGASRTPECYLFDKAGKLVYRGAIDDNPNGGQEVTRKHLAVAMDEMVTGKPVSTSETRSVGCGIKRPR